MVRYFIEEVVIKQHPEVKRVSLWLDPGRGGNDQAETLYNNFGFEFDTAQEQHWMSLNVDSYNGYKNQGFSPKPN